ncbi:MAG: endonuclease/exonuclease/phosphatase, partial [Flavobacteriales bacterium]|nr:endonuclease/exonuclease/phosphatase [Flavobacteriales bacterium]
MEVEGRGLTTQVVFYNVENLFDTADDPRTNDDDFTPGGRLHWTADRYATKLSHLAQAISWSENELPDLIGLAEVENRSVVEDLAGTSPLDGGHYQAVHFDSPDERGIDVALLVRHGVGEVVEERPLRVHLDGDHTRDVLYARLGSGEGTWHVYVCHWPSRREGPAVSAPKRLEAARTLREHLEEVRGPGDRVLIM